MEKLFVISDVHGFYTETKKALLKAGFDENNDTHLLVCLGDVFDRGQESREMLDYLLSIKNKVLVRGNHDQRMLDIINGSHLAFHDIFNGTYDTIVQLFGEGSTPNGILQVSKTDETLIKVKRLLFSTINYYEWGDYIFVHGWLPVNSENPPVVLKDWRNARDEDWHAAAWLEWQKLYGKVAIPEGKTLVCGHRSAALANQFDGSRSSSDYTTFFGKNFIALDACTIFSGFVNVLVLEK